MKTYLSALIIAAAFFSANESQAQMPMSSMLGGGGAYGRPGMGSQPGMDRGIGVNQYGNGKRKPNSADKVNPLDASINYLEKELTLDTFQVTVVKDFMQKNQAEKDKVMNQDIPDEAKMEKFGILRNKLDSDIATLLTPEQQDKFAKLKNKSDKKRS